MLTPEEFIRAGDQLTQSCGWKWKPAISKVQFLKRIDKTPIYLKINNFYMKEQDQQEELKVFFKNQITKNKQ